MGILNNPNSLTNFVENFMPLSPCVVEMWNSDDCGLRALVREAYNILQLQTYYTSGPTETRAWTIKKGWKAPQAAGVIHGDFERGFIRAETITYEDLVACGSEAEVKKQGKLRSEGKEYVVQEGDVILFRFNV